MVIESQLVKEVKDYVVKVLTRQLPEDITYHSINHTEEVVASVNEIAAKQEVGEEEIEILNIAAWFHDIGYVKGYDNHEVTSAEMARDFLTEMGCSEDLIEKVVGCIMATQMPQTPKNNLERILCDGDLMHLADDNYFQKADLLHKEIEKTRFCKISENEWLEMNQEFLNNHCFFTDYAKSNYESAVKENLRKVRERLKSWAKPKK